MTIFKHKLSIMILLSILLCLVLPVASFAVEKQEHSDSSEHQAIIQSDGSEVPILETADPDSDVMTYLKDDTKVSMEEKGEAFSFIYYEDANQDTVEGYVDNTYLEEAVEETAEEEMEVAAIAAADQQRGIALKNKTNVYAADSKDANVLKRYAAGTILQFQSSENIWKQAVVIIDGKATKGYIHQDDIEILTTEQKATKAVAVSQPTNVYKKAATNASKWKSYTAGSVLQLKTLSDNWYEATVIIKGKKVTGFIQHKDTEETFSQQESQEGIALDATPVFTQANTSAKKLKSYPKGSILKYKTLTKNWYEVTVIINGKKKKGYIQAKEMEELIANSEDMRGIGVSDATPVYQKAATDSKKLKTYNKGSILKYKTLSKNWHQATVIINGKKKTGYIQASDVENADKEQKELQGVTFKEKGTNVYSKASTSSKVLKQYPYSSILKYKSFTKNWYEATVIIDGKGENAYIHKNDVKSMNTQLEGFAQKNPTHIYQEASRNSKTIKEYDRGSQLKYRASTKNWHSVNVKINGKYQTGYLAAADVHFEMKDLIYKTTYPYNFKEMVDRQAKKQPNQNGAGTIKSKRGEIEYYTNPANFPANTDEYFQFLVLSTPGGLDAKQINDRVLKGKGSLEGTAQSFINAGKKYSVNEAYLIAHALHETGNGKSTLAQGIPVDNKGNVTRDKKGNIAKTSKTKHTVYNMFGYGAKDSCPIDCGAKHAFDQGWFSVDQSIIGGIKNIHEEYIKKGQNTLYKMRWNPDGGLTPPKIPEWHQYATHTEWAVIQTRRIAEIYSLMDEYVIEMEVPAFLNTPDKAKTTPKTVELKSSASTSSKTVKTLSKNTTVSIVGSNAKGWNKVSHNGKTGWIEAKNITYIY